METEINEVKEEVTDPEKTAEPETTDTDESQKTESTEAKETEKPEETPFDDLATEMGWTPEDEYDGDDWVDARTFLKNANVITKKQQVTIERQRNDLDEIKRGVKKTVDHQKMMAKVEIDKLKSELKATRREAITEGDIEKVEKIDEQIEKIDEQFEDTVEETEINDQIYNDWLKDNDWYLNDRNLSRYADGVMIEYEKTNKPYKEILEIVSSEVAKLNKTTEPEKTKLKKTKAPGGNVTDVIDSTHRSTVKTKYTVKDLPSEFQKVAERFVREGAYKNTQEYVDEYFAQPGEIVK